MGRKNIKFRTVQQCQGLYNDPPDQLIIRIGKACNFRCIFCNVAHNEGILSTRSNIKEILALAFYRLKYSRIVSQQINITISGGEPSIFQRETLFILRYFYQYFRNRNIYPFFDIQSNASNIDIEFARKLFSGGVRQALISSHAHEPRIFYELIGVKYETMGTRFEQGVHSLLDAGIKVTFNIILNKINKDHYFDHIAYLVEKYPQVILYNIGFIQPHGMASGNFSRLVFSYEEASIVYNKVIAYLQLHKKQVHSHLVGLPLCYMSDWSSSMEYNYNKRLQINEQTLIQGINDANKVHPSECSTCMAKKVCSGIWREYQGQQAIRPIPYQIFNPRAHKFSGPNEIRKLYSQGIRQFFVDGSKISCNETIISIRDKGYSWISLVYIGGISLPIVNEAMWGINLQVYFGESTDILPLIHSVKAYNSKSIFQRKIHLDIVCKKIEEQIIPYLNPDIIMRIPKILYKVGRNSQYIYPF